MQSGLINILPIPGLDGGHALISIIEGVIRKELPIKYTAFSNCFRAEAGASGKDTKGLMREHQFGKVELVTFSEPSESRNELDRMIACVESIIKKLDLRPGQKVLDIGCGWGGMAFEIAKQSQCEVKGISLSENQIDYCKKKAKEIKNKSTIKNDILNNLLLFIIYYLNTNYMFFEYPVLNQ